MGFDCAIHVDGVAREDYDAYLKRLDEEGVLDAVEPISFTDAETVHVVGYDGAEFVARYGEFADDDDERLWFLFEFGSESDPSRLAGVEGFELLATKLPKLARLRTEIEVVTGHRTGGGIYRSKRLPSDG